MPTPALILQAVFIVLEFVDLFGDITYLLYFPHCSIWIIWILCYSLFIPFAFCCLIAHIDADESDGKKGGITHAVSLYLGLTMFSEDHD